MEKRRLYISLALIAWIAFIFNRSLQPGDVSGSESGRMLAMLQYFVPFGLTDHIVRKLAHFTEFAILGILAGALAGTYFRRSHAAFFPAVVAGAAVAFCDE